MHSQRFIAMNAFYNPGKDIADDALDGLVASRGGEIRRLSRDKDGTHRIVVSSVVDASKVAVISGGGAGHEPWSTGLVGAGMLTAAVSGGVYASPSAESILTCIRAISVKRVLLLVSNYTGDTLNFRMASQSARSLGISVETVVVKDDVSIHADSDINSDNARRRRGIAGAGIVHKVAGYYAQAGLDLDTVRKMAQLAADSVVSAGVARTVCTIPGASVKKERIPPGSVEVGIGIHGEQGRETVELESSHQAVERICSLVEKHVDSEHGYAGLFNNLGGISNLEAFVAFNDFTKTEMFRKSIKYVAGPVTVCSSLDMAGFSISLVKLDREGKILQALLERSELFPKFIQPVISQPISISATVGEEDAPEIIASENDLIRAKLLGVLDCCLGMRQACNELDSISGDADTGDTIARAAGAVRTALDSNSLPLNEPLKLVGRIGDIVAGSAGGTLGGILSVFLREVSMSVSEENWGHKLERGLKVVCEALQVQPGDRTVIDAMAPAIEVLKDGGTMKQSAISAREGAERTKNMEAKAGRAANVPREALAGTVDPGAEAAARIFEQLAL